MMNEHQVPLSLKRWFLVHFILDILTAIPLIFIPEWFLGFFGWAKVDPIASRVVAAALFAIGIESLLVYNKGEAIFRSMLSLKIIWSLAAISGLGISIIQGFAPWGIWFFLGVFLLFNGVWFYYKLRMG